MEKLTTPISCQPQDNVSVKPLGEEMLILRFSESAQNLNITLDKSYILFFYSMDCQAHVNFQDQDQHGNMNPGDMMMFSYPFANSSLSVTSSGPFYALGISIGKLHEFFGSDFGKDHDELNVFMSSFKMKKYFTSIPVDPEIAVIFHQLQNITHEGLRGKLFSNAKVMELISHYLLKERDNSELARQCPFINDHLEMEKIREARDIIVRDFCDPPTIKELARLVGTNEFKLKVGFRSMFGTSVYAYLSDYRMQKARKMVETKTLNVKEIASQIGYSNSSHFISAYKKKFGITPKKHLQS